MLFLIEYERCSSRLVTFRSFDQGARESAGNERLGIELELNRQGVEREVVLLEAETEEALRRTHRRYFEDLAELATVPGGAD